jgi:hypothetical protein
MEKLYWKRSNGELIDVDEMNEHHLRNALKRMLREEALRNSKATSTENEIPSKYDASSQDFKNFLK